MTHRFFALTASLALFLASAGIAGGAEQRPSAPAVTQPLSIRAADGWVFKGELTLPSEARAGQKFPTVLLVHGSGANDMNETIPEAYARVPGGSSNFLLIAQRLNAAGFAVARFNKRGVTDLGPKTIDPKMMVGPAYTPSGITRDALTLLRAVRQQPGVDASKFFLLGHSEGTDIVSKLAVNHPTLVHGVVAIGVSGESGKDALRRQIVDNQVGYAQKFDQNKDGLISEAEVNVVPEELKVWVGLWEMIGILNSNESRYRFTSAIDPQDQQKVKISNDFTRYLTGYFERTYPDFPFLGPNWGRYMRDSEQFGYTTTILPKYDGPVLMMNGDRDDQTPLSAAVRAYEAVKASGNPDVTLKVYPGTGHTLAPLRNGVTTLGPINEQALTDLTRWLKAHSK